MKKILQKEIVSAVLYLLILAGCSVQPQMASSPQLDRANISEADWGVLAPYIGLQYINTHGNILGFTTDPTTQVILMQMHMKSGLHENGWYHTYNFEIRPTQRPDTYVVKIPYSGGVFTDTSGRIRIGPDGQGQPLDDLDGFQLHVTPDQITVRTARIGAGDRGMINPAPFKRDVYIRPDGSQVQISYVADSDYQAMRADKQFGVWENHLGRTFVSERGLLTVDKDDAGNLVLTEKSLRNDKPVRYAFSPPPGLKLLSLSGIYNGFSTHKLSLNTVDQLEMEVLDGLLSPARHGALYMPRGNRIYVIGYRLERDSDIEYVASIYRPITQERLQAALVREAEVAREREQRRHIAARDAAKKADDRYAMSMAIMSGVVQGLQNAQTSLSSQASTHAASNVSTQLNEAEQRIKADEAARIMTSLDLSETMGTSLSSSASSGLKVQEHAPSAVSVSRDLSPEKQRASEDRYQPVAPRACTLIDEGEKTAYGYGKTRDSAISNARLRMCGPDQSGARKPVSVNLQCEEEKQYMRVPVPGNPLKFTREERPSTWNCSGTFRCDRPREDCSSGGSGRGVRQ